MKAGHFFPILLMPLLVSCTAHTYLIHLPAEPMFTGKEKIQAQAFVGLQHSELQMAGKIVNHLGVSANLYYGYFNVNSYSQEYSLHGYTALGKKLYAAMSAGYTMAKADAHIPVMNTTGTYGGKSQYHGFHVQPCIYYVNTGKKKETPFEFKTGLGVKISGLEYRQLHRFDNSADMGGKIVEQGGTDLSQAIDYYFYTPYLVFQRTRPSGFYFKTYLGCTFVMTQSKTSTYSHSGVGTYPSTKPVVQYPRFLPLLIAASVGFTFK